MSNPPVYIIVPCYNCVPYVRRCLDSIKGNSYPNLHVLCIDDGSVDDSAEILERYCLGDGRFSLIKKKNGGLSSARNAGLDAVPSPSEGFVTFVDADDYVNDGFVSAMVSIALSNNADVVVGSYYLTTTTDEQKSKLAQFDEQTLSGYEALLRLLRDEEVTSMAATKMFRLSTWGATRFPENYCFFEDVATTFQVVAKSNRVVLSPYCGYHYYQSNQSSLTKSKMTNDKIKSCWNALLSIYQYSFLKFDETQSRRIKHDTVPFFFKFFFEYYPHFDKSKDRAFLFNINKYIKRERLLSAYKPSSLREKLFKWMHLASPSFHYSLRRCWLMIRGRISNK